MTSSIPVVHVVDDDASALKATERILRHAGHTPRLYPSAGAFLADVHGDHGCVLLDLRLPDSDGLEIQDHLNDIESVLSVIVVSGHGNVPRTVRAMKAGALDFLVKPVEAALLLQTVDHALARNREAIALKERRAHTRTAYERLTPREREVFAHIISGQLNKQVAFDLGTSEHTIKVHRQRVMEKMEADSVADLVRQAGLLAIAPVGQVREH